jgi:small subunit ribosomal protein S18
MKKKLFVSNLDFDVTEEQLQEMFGEVGPTVSCVLATDRETKRSKGFAFVEMDASEDATKAIEALNNKVVNGRPVRVTEDRGKGGTSGPGDKEGGGPRRQREQLPPIQRMTLFKRRMKLDPFLMNAEKKVDYRDIATLKRFVSERGKILSRRLTGLSAYNQRKVKKAIKRAQNMGLMPFSSE